MSRNPVRAHVRQAMPRLISGHSGRDRALCGSSRVLLGHTIARGDVHHESRSFFLPAGIALIGAAGNIDGFVAPLVENGGENNADAASGMLAIGLAARVGAATVRLPKPSRTPEARLNALAESARG